MPLKGTLLKLSGFAAEVQYHSDSSSNVLGVNAFALSRDSDSVVLTLGLPRLGLPHLGLPHASCLGPVTQRAL